MLASPSMRDLKRGSYFMSCCGWKNLQQKHVLCGAPPKQGQEAGARGAA